MSDATGNVPDSTAAPARFEESAASGRDDDAVILGDVDDVETQKVPAGGGAESANGDAVLSSAFPAPSVDDKVEHRNLPRFPGRKSAIEDLAAMTVEVGLPPKPPKEKTTPDQPDAVPSPDEVDVVDHDEEAAGALDETVDQEAESPDSDDFDSDSEAQGDGYRIVSDQDDESDQPPQSMSA